MKILYKILVLLFLVDFITIAPSYCQSPNAENKKIMNIIFSKKIFPKVDFRDATASIEIWTKELIPQVSNKYALNNIFIEGIDQVEEKFIDNDIDFIVLTAFEYLYNEEKTKNLVPTMVSSGDDNRMGIEYVILIRKDSNIKSLKDLKNKTLSVIDNYSNVEPRLWLDIILKQETLSTANKFFKNTVISQNGNQAILKTFFKQVDACIVPLRVFLTSVELNPQLETEMLILKKSPPFFVGVFCTHKKVNEKLGKEVLNISREAITTKKGKQLALFFKTEDIIDYDPKYLENIKTLIDQAKKYKLKIGNY